MRDETNADYATTHVALRGLDGVFETEFAFKEVLERFPSLTHFLHIISYCLYFLFHILMKTMQEIL